MSNLDDIRPSRGVPSSWVARGGPLLESLLTQADADAMRLWSETIARTGHSPRLSERGARDRLAFLGMAGEHAFMDPAADLVRLARGAAQSYATTGTEAALRFWIEQGFGLACEVTVEPMSRGDDGASKPPRVVLRLRPGSRAGTLPDVGPIREVARSLIPARFHMDVIFMSRNSDTEAHA
jgi:hypothetical protein